MSQATARHYLNGVDVYEAYGLVVSGGSASFLAMPKRKATLSFDWPDESGTEHDLDTVVFEEKQVSLRCAIVANSPADFWAKRKAFYAALCLPGWHRWTVADHDRGYQVFFQAEGNASKPAKSLKAPGKTIATFDLTLTQNVEDWLLNQGFVTGQPLSLAVQATNVTAYGERNGTVKAIGQGGSGSYQYSLGGTTWTAATAGSHTFTGLGPGVLAVKVRDAGDVSKTATVGVTLTEPAAAGPLALVLTGTDATSYGAANGAIKATASGGSGWYQYRKDPQEPWGVATQGALTFTGLAAGGYTVEGRDAKVTSNTVQASLTLGQPAAPVTVTAYYGWKAGSGALTLSQIQAGTAVGITAGADITADYRANTQPMYLWMAEPSSEPLKTKWYGSVDNNGNIGTDQDLFGPPAVADGFRFYITEYPTQNAETTIQFRKA